VALYQPAGLSPRDTVQRQTMIFMAAFALLLLMIAAGLVATYRLTRRESEIARLKSDFVANVSHDLKTPLALIRMFAETLEMDRVPDERRRREYYRVLTRESERLSRLIDNVLDFSRIESGRQRYEITAGPVEPIVHEVVESFRHPLDQQGFTVDVAIEPDLPDVPLDGDAMKQALANLVDNAAKYSATAAASGGGPPGTEDRGGGGGRGHRHPGRRAGADLREFYRVGRSETQGRRGSGVGLAWSSTSWRPIGAASRWTGGPARVLASPSTSPLSPQGRGQGEGFGMPRILIVDDEPEMLRGLEDNLQFEGYQTVTAGDGKKGLTLALSEAPDLILLDVMMPGMSGLGPLPAPAAGPRRAGDHAEPRRARRWIACWGSSWGRTTTCPRPSACAS
jgi:hypothetical protein